MPLFYTQATQEDVQPLLDILKPFEYQFGYRVVVDNINKRLLSDAYEAIDGLTANTIDETNRKTKLKTQFEKLFIRLEVQKDEALQKFENGINLLGYRGEDITPNLTGTDASKVGKTPNKNYEILLQEKPEIFEIVKAYAVSAKNVGIELTEHKTIQPLEAREMLEDILVRLNGDVSEAIIEDSIDIDDIPALEQVIRDTTEELEFVTRGYAVQNIYLNEDDFETVGDEKYIELYLSKQFTVDQNFIDNNEGTDLQVGDVVGIPIKYTTEMWKDNPRQVEEFINSEILVDLRALGHGLQVRDEGVLYPDEAPDFVKADTIDRIRNNERIGGEIGEILEEEKKESEVLPSETKEKQLSFPDFTDEEIERLGGSDNVEWLKRVIKYPDLRDKVAVINGIFRGVEPTNYDAFVKSYYVDENTFASRSGLKFDYACADEIVQRFKTKEIFALTLVASDALDISKLIEITRNKAEDTIEPSYKLTKAIEKLKDLEPVDSGVTFNEVDTATAEVNEETLKGSITPEPAPEKGYKTEGATEGATEGEPKAKKRAPRKKKAESDLEALSKASKDA